MLEYILIGYALTVIIFFGWTIKDASRYSIKIVLSFLLLSLAWPIVLTVYLLEGREA